MKSRITLEDGRTLTGTFQLTVEQRISGELSLAGSQTQLFLHDPEFFTTHDLAQHYLASTLRDLSKVSLHDCVTLSGPGSATSEDGEYTFAELFPHYIIHGHRHLAPDDEEITRVVFEVDDADVLFFDFDAFGQILDPAPLIDMVAHANKLDREIPIGPRPAILYFTGRTELFSVATDIGAISAHHTLLRRRGGTKGVGIENRTKLVIEPDEPISFEDAINRVSILLRFLEILAGRPQNLIELSLSTGAPSALRRLDVYWSMRPRRPDIAEKEKRRRARCQSTQSAIARAMRG